MRGKCERGRGKCERGRGSANADGAGAKAFAGDGCSQGRLSAPWPRFHGVDRPDVYIIIHVRATCCGECALNPPPSQHIPHRRPALAHAAPTHTHAAPTHARRPHNTFPAEDLRSPTHSDTPFPSTSAPPRSPDARPQAARCTPRRPHNTFPAAPRCLPFRSALGTKKRHRTVHVRCRMSRSTVVAVGHLGW